MIIEINGIPPSINRFIGRNNKYAYWAAKKEWDKLVYSYAVRRRPLIPYRRAKVHIHFLFPTRRKHDAGNMEKFITDGLVDSGVIQDDNCECIVLVLSGEYKKGERKTIVEVTEL